MPHVYDKRVVLAVVLLQLWLAPGASADEHASETESAKAAATVERTSDEISSDSAVTVPKPRSLEDLLLLVQQGFETERDENREREDEFKRRRDDQHQLLAEAVSKRERLEALSQQLGHSDMSMRLSAIRQLTHFGEPAVPPLD